MGLGPVIWTQPSPNLISLPTRKLSQLPTSSFAPWLNNAQALVLCVLLPPQLPLSFLLHHEIQRSAPLEWFCSVCFCPGHSTESPSWHFTCVDVMSETCLSASAHVVQKANPSPCNGITQNREEVY